MGEACPELPEKPLSVSYPGSPVVYLVPALSWAEVPWGKIVTYVILMYKMYIRLNMIRILFHQSTR
jgi:hypothetical protein